METERLRPDHRTILDWVVPGSSVLDLGCGDGELLELLARERQVRTQGIEINEQAIYRCVARGLSVLHQDIENGLEAYDARSFDYVILNQSLQQLRRFDPVLREALRVGNQVIVGFPNFAHYRARLQMLLLGTTPITPSLPHPWHDTPNLHFLSIADFVAYCRKRKIRIEKSAGIGAAGKVRILPNLFAHVGIFLVS